MTTKRIIQDTEIALDELLIDSNILLGDPDKCKLEVGKRALDIYYKFEEKPRAIKFDDVKKLAESKGSQIRKPEGYLGHVSCTAVKLANLVKILGEKHPRLKLPHPENAFAMGLVHDLNATFSDYAKGGQQ